MQAILYTLTLITIASCSIPEKDFERTNIKIDKQKIEILTAYKIFENYQIKKGDYSKNVFNKIEKEFIENAEYPFILESIKNDIKPDEKLIEYIKILKNINLEQLVEFSFTKIIKELPGTDTKILFIPANPEYADFFRENQIGVTAITVGSGKIIVSINPTSNNWKEQLPYVLAHEYHHSVWTSRNFKTEDFTPLEYLIFEGRADSFAKKLFPKANNPWTNVLDKEKEKHVWTILKPELNKRKTEMNDIMMIGNNEIPYCSGYTIGFNIVEEFKKNNPDVNDKTLIDIKPEKILELSLYEMVMIE